MEPGETEAGEIVPDPQMIYAQLPSLMEQDSIPTQWPLSTLQRTRDLLFPKGARGNAIRTEEEKAKYLTGHRCLSLPIQRVG